MKKIMYLALVLMLALCLPLAGCGKKKPAPEPEDGQPALADDGAAGALPDALPDTLPEELPEPEERVILVGQVQNDSVNVRQAASTTSTALGKVSRGDLLLILKSGTMTGSNGGNWYEVRFDGKSAYIHADYLLVQEMAEDSVISVGSVVNVDSVLNIRAEPNAQSQRVGRGNKGDKFVVLAQGAGDGTWSKIEYADGVEGVAYVKSEYLNVVQQMVVNLLHQ